MAALVIYGLLTACAVAQPYETFPLDSTRVFGPDIRDVDIVRFSYSTQSQVALLGWDGFAGRVGATGQVLDTPSIFVDPRANGDEPADVAAGPEGFAYVYVADVGDSSCTIASIVTSDGRVSGRAVLDFTCACFSPAVASDGEGYLACWMSWDWTNLRILFARLDSAGAVLDSAPRVVAPGFAVSPLALDVVYGESTYLVVWREQGETPGEDHMLGWLMHRDGSPVSDTAIEIGMNSAVGRPCVAFNGRDFVVTWVEHPYTVVAQRVSQSGEVLNGPGVPLTSLGTEPAVASLGDTSLFVWVERELPDYGYTVRGIRLDGSLCKLDSAPFSLSPTMTTYAQDMPASPTIAVTSDRFLVGWAHPALGRTDWPYSNRDAVVRQVSPSGQLLDSSISVVSLAANAQLRIVAASCRSVTLTAWTDYRPGASETLQVRGRLFRPGGVAASGVFPIGPRYSCQASVSAGEGGFLVAWSQLVDSSSCALAVRVDTVGRLLDSIPIRLPSRRGRIDWVDVAYEDGVYLVVWSEDGVFARGARIGDDGALLDSVALDFNLDGREYKYMRVASAESVFLVVGHTYNRGIRGLRVKPDGQIVDTAVFQIGDRTSPPCVAFGDGLFLVVTQLFGNSAWRVTPHGEVLDSVINLPDGYDAYGVVFDGTDFLIGVTLRDDPARRVLGVRVASDGRVVDPVPIPLLDGAWPGWNASFMPACDSAGCLFLPGITVDTFPDCLASRAVAAYCPGLAVHDVAAGTPNRLTRLEACRPNPFSGRTTISYECGQAGVTRLAVFDVSGRVVRTLCDGFQPVGRYSVTWDGTAGNGQRVPAGVYFYRLDAGGQRLVKKAVISR